MVPGLPAQSQDLVLWFKTLLPMTPDRAQHETTLKELTDQLPTSALPGVDYDMRWKLSWRTHSWDSMAVDEADLLMAEAIDVVTVAAGLSMHRNGHIRQRAVAKLDQAGTHCAIRWLVLRCGDWVPQVRDQAWRSVSKWLSPEHAEELADSLPLLAGDRFATGRAYSSLRTDIASVLRDPASLPAVEQGAQSSDRHVRRACTKLLVETNADVGLLRRTMKTNDVVAIAMVAASLPTDGGSVNRQTGKLLLKSPMARFRYEGLWRLTKDDEPGSEELIREALEDPAPSVRDVARRWLADRGQDADHIYRSMIAENRLAALRGLGDQPKLEDADLARRHISDQEGPVRVAALRLLAGIGAGSDGSLFAERFSSGTAKERRQALMGLRQVGIDRFVDAMWAEMADDRIQSERLIRQVLPLAGRWKRIDVALQAVSSEDRPTRAAGFETLRRLLLDWNRGYAGWPPDPKLLRDRLEEARSAFADVEDHCGNPSVFAALESMLKSSAGS